MRTRTRTILAGLVLAAALVGGVAWATIPGADGTIQGCYTKSKGNLRVVDSADECKNSETAISWNQRGQTGAAGAQGPTGATGTKGDTGPAGANGTNGAPGAKGETGAAGTNGTNGTDGATGDKGDTGPAGTNGTNGAAGAKGDPGLRWRGGYDDDLVYLIGDVVQSNGSAWVAAAVTHASVPPQPPWELLAQRGLQGAAGANGTAGAAGATGATGPTGPAGPAGPQGPSGVANVVARFNDKATSATNDSAVVNCNAGEKATGGGVQLLQGFASEIVYYGTGGIPVGNPPSGWSTRFHNSTNHSAIIRVYVVCVS